MEAMYKLLLGPINPKRPADAFAVQVWLLKRLGLWPPETDNKLIQILYTIWSYFYRWFFLYLYVSAQVLFFLKIDDLTDVAQGFFFLLTQICLLYKVEKFYKNRFRIQACEKILRSSLFCPQNEEEDSVIKESMAQTLAFCMAFLITAHLTIAQWAIAPLSMEGTELPIIAWYPFDLKNPWIYWSIYSYQLFGVSMSACFNVSTDTFGSAIIAQTNGQVRRLGIMLSKIGFQDEEKLSRLKVFNRKITQQLDELFIDDEMAEINAHIEKLKKSKDEHYGEVVRCIIFHKHVLNFAAEVESIFCEAIFAQLMASCIIICMTCFLMANNVETVQDFIGAFSYLVTMVVQILLFCWIGNELIYSSQELSTKAYFSNFSKFDRPTSKALILFMHKTLNEIKVKAGTIFTVTLSLPSFMSILKSSYSYFAVLQSMQEK